MKKRLALLLGTLAAALLVGVSPAVARTYRCALSAAAYRRIVASNIWPVSPDIGKAFPRDAACAVAGVVVSEASLQIDMDHVANPHAPYDTTLKLTLSRPADVNAIEIWRFRIRYPRKGSMHGFAVGTCAKQRITFTLLPNPPKVIGG